PPVTSATFPSACPFVLSSAHFRSEWRVSSAARGRRRVTEFRLRDGVKQSAEVRRAPTTEGRLKIFLRLRPARAGRAQPCRADLGQMHDFAPAVDAARYDLDQSFARPSVVRSITKLFARADRKSVV